MRRLFLASCFALGAAIVGCGGGKGEINGNVTFDGKPMTKGQVSMQASDGTIHAGDITPEGKYEVKNVPSGTVKIAVSYTDDSQTEYFRALSKAGRDGGAAPKGPPKLLYQVPDRFTSFDASGLTSTIKSGGKTEFNITVTSK